MIDFSEDFRRRYSPLDKDKLDILDDIAEHLSELPAIGDELHRIADALELTEHPADTDSESEPHEPAAAWTIADNNGVTVCEGVTKNTGAFVFSALTEYAKRNAPELAFTYKDNGNG